MAYAKGQDGSTQFVHPRICIKQAWILELKVLTLREIEKFIIRQPPKGEKDDYDSENSWISDSRRILMKISQQQDTI